MAGAHRAPSAFARHTAAASAAIAVTSTIGFAAPAVHAATPSLPSLSDLTGALNNLGEYGVLGQTLGSALGGAAAGKVVSGYNQLAGNTAGVLPSITSPTVAPVVETSGPTTVMTPSSPGSTTGDFITSMSGYVATGTAYDIAGPLGSGVNDTQWTGTGYSSVWSQPYTNSGTTPDYDPAHLGIVSGSESYTGNEVDFVAPGSVPLGYLGYGNDLSTTSTPYTEANPGAATFPSLTDTPTIGAGLGGATTPVSGWVQASPGAVTAGTNGESVAGSYVSGGVNGPAGSGVTASTGAVTALGSPSIQHVGGSVTAPGGVVKVSSDNSVSATGGANGGPSYSSTTSVTVGSSTHTISSSSSGGTHVSSSGGGGFSGGSHH
jgi:hypothetical protein